MKKFVCLLSLVLFVGLLSACGYTDEEINQMEEWKESGIDKASYYIKDKYGAEFKVDNAEVEKEDPGPVPDFFPDYTSNVVVNGTVNGKACKVFTDASSKYLNDCYDNYQQQEIVKDVEECVYSIYNVTPNSINVYYCDYYYGEEDSNGMINAYYDGNISNFLSEKKFDTMSIEVVYQDLLTLSDIESKISLFENINFYAINYKNGVSFTNMNGTDHTYFVNILNRLVYIKDFYFSSGSEEFQGYHKPDVKQHENFLYVNRVEATPEFNFTWDNSEYVDENGWNTDYASYKRVSDIYRTPEFDAETFYYLSKINNYSDSKEYVVCIKYVKDGETKYVRSYNPTIDDNFLIFNNYYGNGYWFIAEEIEN